MAENKEEKEIVVNEEPQVVSRDEILSQVTEQVSAVKEEFDTKLEEATQRAKTEARDEIVKSISGEKKQEEWKPKSWTENKEVTKKETLEEVERLLKEKEDSKRVELETKAKKEVETVKQWNEYWDKQINNISKEDPNFAITEDTKKALGARPLNDLKPSEIEELREQDPAFDNRIKLQEEAFIESKKSGEPANLELHYYKNWNKNSQSGRNAPVIGTNKSVTPSDNEFSYEDIMGKKPSDVILE